MKKFLLTSLVILLLAGMTGCSKEETVKIEEHDWNLTFVLSSEFLQEGYTFENNENNYKLVAKVIDNKIGSLFLNKSLGNLTNMTIEIVVENSKLVSFNASYTTTNGFDAQIQTTYSY